MRRIRSRIFKVPAESVSRTSEGMASEKILDLMRRIGRPLGTGQVAEAAGVTRPTASRHLQALQEADLVTWEGQSTKDPRATWQLK